MCIFYIDLRRWGSPRQSWGWQQMQRSTPTPTSGSKSAPCPRPCLVCLGMWWWAAGVISLVGRILQWGWICDRDERLDLCQWHCLVFLGICWWALEWYLWKDGDNSDHHQVVDSPSSFPLLAACLQLQSTSGVVGVVSFILLNIKTSSSWSPSSETSHHHHHQDHVCLHYQPRPCSFVARFTSLPCFSSQVGITIIVIIMVISNDSMLSGNLNQYKPNYSFNDQIIF